jgi:hypothetical protein
MSSRRLVHQQLRCESRWDFPELLVRANHAADKWLHPLQALLQNTHPRLAALDGHSGYPPNESSNTIIWRMLFLFNANISSSVNATSLWEEALAGRSKSAAKELHFQDQE